MSAPAVAEVVRSARATVRAAAAELTAARERLYGRIADAQARHDKLAYGAISRAEAEARVGQLVELLVARAGLFLHPLVDRDPAGVANALDALGRTSAMSLAAVRDPDGTKAWLMAEVDRQAALRGGWSSLDADARKAEARRVAAELAGLDAAAKRLVRDAAEAGIDLDPWGDDPEPVEAPSGPVVEVKR